MGIPWKKIGQGVLKGLALGAMFEPHIAAINGLIEGVEAAVTLAGPDKKAIVVAASDAVLASELDGLTPEQEQAIRDARDAYIDTYVALRNAQAKAEDAYDKLQAAIADVKK